MFVIYQVGRFQRVAGSDYFGIRKSVAKRLKVCIAVKFFVFRAEGGIRGKLVTGVQTCALPISTSISSGETYPYGGSLTRFGIVHGIARSPHACYALRPVGSSRRCCHVHVGVFHVSLAVRRSPDRKSTRLSSSH